MFPFLLWLILRILTSLAAALISPLRPLTPLEQTLPLWPPAAPLTAWLERLLLAPWLRWDALWFLRILTQGYAPDDGTANFQPLYPWLAEPLTWLGVHPLLSLMLVGAAAGLGLAWAWDKLANLDLPPEQARLSLLLLFCFPTGFILFAPYTEGLFLLWAVACFYWARRQKWWLAGLAGGLAALTRQQGVFLLLPLAWELWESAGRNLPQALRNPRRWLALGLIPAGLLLWLLYRLLFLGRAQLDTQSLSGLLFSLPISPSVHQVVPGTAMLWPWQALYRAGLKLIQNPDVDLLFNLAASALFLAYLALAWAKLRPAERLYAAAIALASFSLHTGPYHPYMGLPRHLMLAFPAFLGAAARLQKNGQRLALVGLSAFGNLFALGLYVLEAWVP